MDRLYLESVYKVCMLVIPVKTGIQKPLKTLDSRPTDRGNDGSIVEFIHRPYINNAAASIL
ncbi:MAG TPA: hypothetical protein ENH01_09235 [Nitrospirae bacterium]|nr:hypothetical protein [Nitrospirota bacterium]